MQTFYHRNETIFYYPIDCKLHNQWKVKTTGYATAAFNGYKNFPIAIKFRNPRTRFRETSIPIEGARAMLVAHVKSQLRHNRLRHGVVT